MSKILDCRYRGGDRSVIQLTADLDQGWRDLGGVWGFDDSGFLNYEIGTKFQCRVRFAAKASESSEGPAKFPVSEYLTRLELGKNGVTIHGPWLMIDVPLDQPWHPGEDAPDQPSIYAVEPAFWSDQTADSPIEYEIQMWIALDGPTRRFVRHKYDWGEGFALAGRV